MIIGDIIISVPATVLALLKAVKVQANDKMKEEILKNSLYHITSNEQVLEEIVNSQYLKPATGIFKNINSYGKASVCFFNGTPAVDNYMHNMNKSPYLNPTKVEFALKISPKDKAELDNYKVRALSDDAVLFEGYCMLKKDEIEKVCLVPDLVRDIEGKPIVNPRTKRYDIAFREASEDELDKNRTEYVAKADYLEFVKEEKNRLNYLDNNKIIGKIINPVIMIFDIEKKMRESTIRTSKKNFPTIIKEKIKNLSLAKLEVSADERVEQNISGKNPYKSAKFAKKVISYMQEGLIQLNLNEELKKITTSKEGEYLRKKSSRIRQTSTENASMNKYKDKHREKVALLAMIIANNEGILENDDSNKTKDIILSASYFYDNMRKKELNNMTYANGKEYTEEDMKLLKAVVGEFYNKKKETIDKICDK